MSRMELIQKAYLNAIISLERLLLLQFFFWDFYVLV